MLSSTDRDFFGLLSEAAFANPFGEERERIDRRIAGAPKGAKPGDVLDRVLARVRARLVALGDVRALAAGDRPLVEQGILFDVFHRHAAALDALIQDQLTSGARPVRVRFGHDAIAEMVRAGFEHADALRWFAIFFQLRRAFYFIERTLPGGAPSMRRLRERLWANVFTHDARLYARLLWRRMEDFSTFLLGETGSGKGIAAAAIGRSGWIPYDERAEAFAESFVGSFLSINLSQFSEALIESELFGHRKGAFTGAVETHEGVFARCSPHGAIFLDEIGEIGVPTQIKLLRVLQERAFSPVGAHETVRFAGRVIAATNRSLDDLRARGQFRDDFYYRLCSDVIEVPSLVVRLREAPNELDVLLASIVRRMLGEDSAETCALVREVIERDLGASYAWPGNVRELEQCVRRVVLTREYRGDRPAPPATSEPSPPDDARLLEVAGGATAKALLGRYCKALYARHGTYEEVARRTGLDRRTAKAYVAAR